MDCWPTTMWLAFLWWFVLILPRGWAKKRWFVLVLPRGWAKGGGLCLFCPEVGQGSGGLRWLCPKPGQNHGILIPLPNKIQNGFEDKDFIYQENSSLQFFQPYQQSEAFLSSHKL